MKPLENPWIGVDLDGCLAFYEDWHGISVVGKPIPSMLKRVKDWLEEGKTVKIFTARAASGQKAINVVKAWLKHNGLPDLEVTHKKDHDMIELWDDHAVTVETNTGKILTQGK
jgi:hypothetical protein